MGRHVNEPYFKHSYYFADSGPIKRLRRRFGAEGYATYTLAKEYLYRNDGKALTEAEVDDLASDLSLEKDRVLEIMDYLTSSVACHLLEKAEDGYSSQECIRDLLEMERYRNMKAEAGRKSGEARRRKVQQ